MGTTPPERPPRHPPLVETNVDHLLPTHLPSLQPHPGTAPAPYAAYPLALPHAYGPPPGALVALPIHPAFAQSSMLWRRYWVMSGVIMVGGGVLALILGLFVALSPLLFLGLASFIGVLFCGGFFAVLAVGLAAAGTAMTRSAGWGHIMGLGIATALSVLVLWLSSVATLSHSRGQSVGMEWFFGLVLLQVVVPYALAMVGGWLWARTLKPKVIYAWAQS